MVAGTGGTVLVSGCSRLSSSRGYDVSLTQIVVANLHDEEHVMNLQLSYDGDTIIDGVYTLPPQTGEVAPSKVIDDRLPDEPGRFGLTAWTDDEASKGSELNVGSATDSDEVWAEVVTLDGVRTLVSVEEGTATDTD